MSELYDIQDNIERVILVGVATNDTEEVVSSLNELKELADTAGAVTIGTLIQNREQIHPGTYIGKGKAEEIKECCERFFK